MAEVGCLKDGCFQNLQVEGNMTALSNVDVTGMLKSSKLLQSSACANVEPTEITTSTLSVNTFYVGATTTSLAMIIPSAAASNIGDFINVIYSDGIANDQVHSYTTEDAQFTKGSTLLRVGGAKDSALFQSVDGSDQVNLTGDDDGDGGAGTSLRFVNVTGEANGWAVEVIIYNQGTGVTAKNAATIFRNGTG